MTSICKNPWLFACQWYQVDQVHSSITRAEGLSKFGEPVPVPTDVSSREFAEFLTEQYRLAMRKGAELAISEMNTSWCGTPIYATPSRFNGNCGRVFARDVGGQVVAEFLGENGFDDAVMFCQLFGEKNGWRVAEVSDAKNDS